MITGAPASDTERPAGPAYVPIGSQRLSPFLVRQLPEAFVRANRVLPLGREGDLLRVAMADPEDSETLAQLRTLTASLIQPVLSSPTEIDAALDRIFAPQRPPDASSSVFRILLHVGFLTAHQAAALEMRQTQPGGEPASGHAIGAVSEEDYVEALGLAIYVPRLRLDQCTISPAFAGLVSKELAERWQMVPAFSVDGEMVLASPHLLPDSALEEIRESTGFQPRPVLCTPSEARRGLERAFAPLPRKVAAPAKPLWKQLTDDGSADKDQVERARTLGQHTGESVEQVLLRLGELDPYQILDARAHLHGTKLLRLPQLLQADRSLAVALPEATARRRRCLALRLVPRGLEVAVSDLEDKSTLDLLAFLFGLPVHPLLSSEEELASAIRSVYAPSEIQRAVGGTRLVELLVRLGRLTPKQAEQGLQRQRETDAPLGKCLIELGMLDEIGLAEVLGIQLKMPWITVSRYRTDPNSLRLIQQETALQHAMLPLYSEGSLATVVMANPQSDDAMRDARRCSGMDVRPVIAGEQSLRAAINRLYSVDLSAVSEELREFGDILVEWRLLNREQLLKVWEKHLQADVPFDMVVTAMGYLTEQQLADAMARYLKLPRVDLTYRSVPVSVVDGLGVQREIVKWTEPLDAAVASLLPEDVAQRFTAIPVKRAGNSVSVAFANPLRESTWRSVQDTLGEPISVAVATRSEIMEATRRIYGRRTVGDLLLEADLINRRQLEDGLRLHQRAGVRLGKALVSLGYVTQSQLVDAIAQQRDLPYFTLAGVDIPDDVARSVPENLARSHGLLPISRTDSTITVAMINPMDTDAIQEVEQATGCRVDPVMTTEDDLEDALERTYRADYLWQSANDLVFRYPDDSAMRVLTAPQKLFFVVLLGVSVLLVMVNALAYFTALIVLSTLFYISFSSYKFYLIYKALAHTLELDVLDEDVAELDDRDLPVYTVLVPLYREAAVLPTLVRAIDNLDYPKTKLDVKLLLEEDDKETLAVVRRHPLPSHIKPVVVPNAKPKGKPKACNYGLLHAEGELVVIYDAEDIPERDQLKKVVVAFRKADPRVQCIQAKLNYYNRNQNLLTRWFTTEYSMWFDLFIPGLDASNAPIPLGGTSNHFRTQQLRELGAWDPWNVTEDADLGVRLFKAGWKTAVVDSTTYEEANSELYNWIRQRSRWVKGYVQTYLVHMRHPIKLMKEIGPYQFFSFNMVVGGTFFGFLMNPIFWLLTVLWYLTRWDVIQMLYPTPIFYIGAMGLYIGNFAFMYTNVAGCMRRQYYDMVKYALISPLYWALMSVGAWKGFLQLFYRPSYWEKTVHGLYQGRAQMPVGTIAPDSA